MSQDFPKWPERVVLWSWIILCVCSITYLIWAFVVAVGEYNELQRKVKHLEFRISALELEQSRKHDRPYQNWEQP